MKKIPAFLLFSFFACFLQAQQFPTVTPSQIAKLDSVIHFIGNILESNTDTTYGAQINQMKIWFRTPQLRVGTFNQKGNIFHLIDSVNTSIVVIPDSSMNFFSAYGKNASLVFMPIWPPNQRYLYLRYSAIDTMSVENLALQFLHEMFHVWQYVIYHQKYFADGSETLIVLRESEAWKFEASLFFQLHPEYKKYIPECDCRGNLLYQMGMFSQKHQLRYQITDYIFVYICPKTWFKNLITQRK